MLRFWQSYRSAILVWVFCGITAVVGFLVVYPAYVNVCEDKQPAEEQKCEPYEVLYLTFLRLYEATTHLELWVAAAITTIAVFTYKLNKSIDKLWQSSKAQIDLSRDILLATERPWVGPRTIDAEPTNPNEPITAWVVIENTGRSPAREMRVDFQGHILPSGMAPPRVDVALRPAKMLFSSFPDTYHPFRGHRLSQAEFDGIVRGDRVAWIIGRIEYMDTRNDLHFTDVCTRWDPTLRAFVPHEQGNDAN
jgi:hypothetical protein